MVRCNLGRCFVGDLMSVNWDRNYDIRDYIAERRRVRYWQRVGWLAFIVAVAVAVGRI